MHPEILDQDMLELSGRLGFLQVKAFFTAHLSDFENSFHNLIR